MRPRTLELNRRGFLTRAGTASLAALGAAAIPVHNAGAHGHDKAKPAAAATKAAAAPSIVRAPTDLPPPIRRRGPETVRVGLETTEVVGQLADGTTYTYWTFNGKVPGPFVRVRVGDTVEVSLKNAETSLMDHNVDFHAVLGPHGGGGLTHASPGETKSFAFKAVKPGLYVYHCAIPMAAQHIASGMYGLILVEPERGLPKVDREFYVMQGEIYTDRDFGTTGHLEPSYEKLMNERPDYFVFNGAVGALTEAHPLKAKVGETVRLYFGVGGPNFTSSFHVIGGIFDKVYNLGALTVPPLTEVQTVSVAPGGATVVDMAFPVPGRYALVDHALTRVERGLIGFLDVEGPANANLFRSLNPTT